MYPRKCARFRCPCILYDAGEVLGAVSQAFRDGLGYIWVDTCYIVKSSSAELSEVINSMLTWYSKDRVCYGYLSDFLGGDLPIEDGPLQFR